jgi:hypothetical protein
MTFKPKITLSGYFSSRWAESIFLDVFGLKKSNQTINAVKTLIKEMKYVNLLLSFRFESPIQINQYNSSD